MDASYGVGDTARKTFWHTDVLPANVRRALDYLGGRTWLKRTSWYMAGGTALALQVGHRTSQDLDFFNPKEFSPQVLVKKFSSKDWKTKVLREGTVYGSLLGAKASFIFYPFFLPKESPLFYESVRVLHAKDIAVMKVVAISQRGTKRDFIDLFWYCLNREPLLSVIGRLRKQYPHMQHNYHHIIKSLAYFEDAESDPMPEIFFGATWADVKKFFQKETPQVTSEFLKLR